MRTKLICAMALLSLSICAETLGFLEQKFNSINFEKGKWNRTDRAACFVYAAKESGALVEIIRFGSSSLVPFRANTAGLTVTVCGSTAAFDEGFEARAKP